MINQAHRPRNRNPQVVRSNRIAGSSLNFRTARVKGSPEGRFSTSGDPRRGGDRILYLAPKPWIDIVYSFNELIYSCMLLTCKPSFCMVLSLGRQLWRRAW